VREGRQTDRIEANRYAREEIEREKIEKTVKIERISSVIHSLFFSGCSICYRYQKSS
jgi:hypothetical protein